MYIVAGLGNPGNEYQMTRHNIGFEVIDYMAAQYNIKVNKIKFKGICGECNISGEKVVFLKPQTYMNLSGDSVREIMQYYGVPSEKLIVVYDDIAIEPGKIRIRSKGGPGGHNGLKSIIYNLKTEEFIRMRLGVGTPGNEKYNLADFVLGHFTKEDIPIMEKAIIRASDAIADIIKDGVGSAMNKYNGMK